MPKPKLINTLLFFLVLAAVHSAPASAPPSRLDSLRQSILALDSAWTRAIKDFQSRKQSGSLAQSEQKDYAKFITYLSSRMDHYCSLLRSEGGDGAVLNLPCAEAALPAADFEKPTARTKEEQVSALDKSLTEALGEFDEQLLKEEEKIAARTPAERESGRGYGSVGEPGGSGRYGSGQTGSTGQSGTAGSSQGQESSQSGSGGSQGEEESSRSGSGSSQSGQGSGASSSGAGAGTGSQDQQDDTRSSTRDLESGYDDIVARQLREAAEKETDPELKKKLWEEYRKYKEGIH